MTFAAWLKKQKDRPDPVGHLSDDTFYDPCCIPFAKSPSILRKHMVDTHNACNASIDALAQASKEWKTR